MEQLLTPESLAAYLGLSRQTIYNRHSMGGELPVIVRIGRLIRFHPKDVEYWLERQRDKPKPTSLALAAPKKRKGRPTKAEQIAARGNKRVV